MASRTFSRQYGFRREVLISAGDELRRCSVAIDDGGWAPDAVPLQIGGFVNLPRVECEALASSDRLILKLSENGEPYRMILDGSNGRFLARKL